MSDEEEGAGRAFEFDGNWREFAPIAFTNLLLTVVTLGVYLFWARARERRYLWSHTHFIDDRLEWAGTGLELFIGYVLAILIFVVPLTAMNFGFQYLMTHGQFGWATLLFILLYFLAFYLVGVAIFRALRYRLSRTFWHGIRGGSDTQGLNYGLSHVFRTMIGSLAIGLMVPWSMTSLWNKRWRAMSFGPYEFEADARWEPLMGRFLLYYLSPIIVVIFGAVFSLALSRHAAQNQAELQANLLVGVIGFYIVFFIVLGMVALIYYSAFYREAIGKLSFGEIDFDFDATTGDWFRLMIVNIALVVFTLGIGAIFVNYRNWSFFIRHLNAFGTVRLNELTQSETRAPGQGEGLLDAFDVGAI